MRALPLPHGSPKCLCRSCGLYFTSESPFAEHRVGTYGIDRRCLTETELRAKGFEPNEAGYWRRPMPAEKLAKMRGSHAPD